MDASGLRGGEGDVNDNDIGIRLEMVLSPSFSPFGVLSSAGVEKGDSDISIRGKSRDSGLVNAGLSGGGDGLSCARMILVANADDGSRLPS